MGGVGRFHFIGFIVSRDYLRPQWEVIQPAKQGTFEVSFRSAWEMIQ